MIILLVLIVILGGVIASIYTVSTRSEKLHSEIEAITDKAEQNPKYSPP